MPDYQQIFKDNYKRKKKILEICPTAKDESGIYFFLREENGFKYGYVGQAVKVLSRLANHLAGYDQHIDRSILKHKLWSNDNPTGWKIYWLPFPEEQLNEKEQYYIKLYANAGYQMRNKTSGSQDGDKSGIADNQPAKGYHDGLKQGRENLRKELAHIIEKHLIIYVKKDTIPHQKALAKFHKLLEEPKEDKGEENGNIQQD